MMELPSIKEKNSPAIVLYIGTTKLMASRITFGLDRSVHVEAWQRREPKGFEGGLICDSEVATETVRELLESVGGEKSFYQLPLYTVISNAQIQNYQVSSSIYFPVIKTIGEQDIENVVSQTRSIATIPLNEIIIWTIPEEYLVNDLPEIKNPLGLEGKRLSVTLHLFTMPVTAYRGLENLFDRLEVESEIIMPRGLASSLGTLHEEEKREGCLLVEVGGTLTELFYFYQGALRFSTLIPWGSEQLTDRIARKWELSPKEARKIKEEFGTFEANEARMEDIVPVADASGRVRLKIPCGVLHQELQSGILEGLGAIETEIKKIKARHTHLYQLVFSGGMTRMPGFLELIQSNLSTPSRLGFVSHVHGPNELLNCPAHNGLLGLAKYLTSYQPEEKVKRESVNFFTKTVDNVKGWLQEYF